MDDSMQLTSKKNKHRTLLYNGSNQHVGTIVEQSKTSYQWLVQKATGHATSYDAAYDAIVQELKKS